MIELKVRATAKLFIASEREFNRECIVIIYTFDYTLRIGKSAGLLAHILRKTGCNYGRT